MKKSLVIVIFFISIFTAFSQNYITNVTVIDVLGKKAISNQTVVITDDLITDIKSSKKIKIPENAHVIDGTGKYLAPGLTDAHVHFSQSGGLYTRPDAIDLRKEKPYEEEMAWTHDNMEDLLRRYLQNGITNVIDVGSTFNFLKQRKDFENSDFAPSINMTGPLLTTYEPEPFKGLENDSPFLLVKTPEEGIKMVQAELKHNPDFIKIWYIVGVDGLDTETSARKSLPTIKAIIDEAHKNNLKVAVHATERITAQLAVENGADFLVHSVDDEVVNSDFVQLLKKNNTIICPTLTVYNGYLHTFSQENNFSNHELLNSNPYQLGTLLDLRHVKDSLLANRYKTMTRSEPAKARQHKIDSISMVNLKLLSDAGVTIATGTDAGNIGTMHASSYLAELQTMQISGMSNWQIIEASTINGAKILNQEDEFGSITIGKKANLILLDANPIDDINNLTKINQVINKGIVFSPEKLVKNTPEALAQRQLNAYNSRNIEAFLEPYADDVEVYNFPNQLMYKGKENMRAGYSKMFENTTNLHCELENRIIQGNVVIDEERVQFGDKIIEATAIYHIKNDKIKKVYFIN